jgi:hypothetical protein
MPPLEVLAFVKAEWVKPLWKHSLSASAESGPRSLTVCGTSLLTRAC